MELGVLMATIERSTSFVALPEPDRFGFDVREDLKAPAAMLMG